MQDKTGQQIKTKGTSKDDVLDKIKKLLGKEDK